MSIETYMWNLFTLGSLNDEKAPVYKGKSQKKRRLNQRRRGGKKR